jgi:hypothetical protein
VGRSEVAPIRDVEPPSFENKHDEMGGAPRFVAHDRGSVGVAAGVELGPNPDDDLGHKLVMLPVQRHQ